MNHIELVRKRKTIIKHPDPRNEKLTIMLSATEYQRFIDYCEERNIAYSTQGRIIIIESLEKREEWIALERKAQGFESDTSTAWLLVKTYFCRYVDERRRFNRLVSYLKENKISVPTHLTTRIMPNYKQIGYNINSNKKNHERNKKS